uniref:Uncharacterized protein n=1 Tax=Rhizophora mucronata TaxID=61149 RepID=A0A2P2MZE0_RHIMU
MCLGGWMDGQMGMVIPQLGMRARVREMRLNAKKQGTQKYDCFRGNVGSHLQSN